jgi:phenylacetate-coenzyme A ligase PaaK-like adenylate-forming protein
VCEVRGRADEVLRYQGVDIHPLVVRSVMVKSPAILDYQVRQTLRGVDVDAVAVAAVDGDDLADHLAQALMAAGLRDPAVSVRIVDRLNRHPETGKLSRFVPLPA